MLVCASPPASVDHVSPDEGIGLRKRARFSSLKAWLHFPCFVSTHGSYYNSVRDSSRTIFRSTNALLRR
jgi:hypothetical protein